MQTRLKFTRDKPLMLETGILWYVIVQASQDEKEAFVTKSRSILELLKLFLILLKSLGFLGIIGPKMDRWLAALGIKMYPGQPAPGTRGHAEYDLV